MIDTDPPLGLSAQAFRAQPILRGQRMLQPSKVPALWVELCGLIACQDAKDAFLCLLQGLCLFCRALAMCWKDLLQATNDLGVGIALDDDAWHVGGKQFPQALPLPSEMRLQAENDIRFPEIPGQDGMGAQLLQSPFETATIDPVRIEMQDLRLTAFTPWRSCGGGSLRHRFLSRFSPGTLRRDDLDLPLGSAKAYFGLRRDPS